MEMNKIIKLTEHTVPVFCVLEEDTLASDVEDWLLAAKGDAKTLHGDVTAENGGLECWPLSLSYTEAGSGTDTFLSPNKPTLSSLLLEFACTASKSSSASSLSDKMTVMLDWNSHFGLSAVIGDVDETNFCHTSVMQQFHIARLHQHRIPQCALVHHSTNYFHAVYVSAGAVSATRASGQLNFFCQPLQPVMSSSNSLAPRPYKYL